MGFPGGSQGKESAYNAGDPGLVPGLGRFPGEGNGYPLQYSCLGNLMDTRSLAGYSPWGHKKARHDGATFTHSRTHLYPLSIHMHDGSRDILDIYMMNYCVKVVQ